MIPASRSTRKWWVSVDGATSTGNVPQARSGEARRVRTTVIRVGSERACRMSSTVKSSGAGWMRAGRRGDLGITHLSFDNHRTIMVRTSLYVEHRNRSDRAGIDDDQAVPGDGPERGSQGRGPSAGTG